MNTRARHRAHKDQRLCKQLPSVERYAMVGETQFFVTNARCAKKERTHKKDRKGKFRAMSAHACNQYSNMIGMPSSHWLNAILERSVIHPCGERGT